MTTHELKTDPAVFQAVATGAKTHEIRLNDRAFEVGDILQLRETVYSGAEMRAGAELLYTGRTALREVSHIQTGYGLLEGWCILSFAEGDAELDYATRLARFVWSTHYSATAPGWEPQADMMGVLSQLDNMLAGLTPREPLPKLNDDLIEILGRPNFQCRDIAARLRQLGKAIRHKAEHEQAASIHFLLGLYLKHGENWRDKAIEELKADEAGAPA